MSSPLITIPARHGLAVKLTSGQTIKVINTHGKQVVDTWAFTLLPSTSPSSTPSHYTILTQMSMPHTHASLNKLHPKIGDHLYDNEKQTLFLVVEDTFLGHHDTLVSACDRGRYRELGVKDGVHRNCADNLGEGLRDVGIEPPQFAPSPLNLWMNIPVLEDRTSISYDPPISKKGDFISLRAMRDLVVVFSACPQDILMTNGGVTTDAHYQIL